MLLRLLHHRALFQAMFATALMIGGPMVVWLGFRMFFDFDRDAAKEKELWVLGMVMLVWCGGVFSLHWPFVGWSKLADCLASLTVFLSVLTVVSLGTGIAVRVL